MAEAKIYVPATDVRSPAAPTTRSKFRVRTRRDKRRFSIYWTWSYPWEANRDVTEMDNRFSTITEVRRVAWPTYETPEYSAQHVPAGHRRHARTVPSVAAAFPAAGWRADRTSGRRVPARRSGGAEACRSTRAFSTTRTR